MPNCLESNSKDRSTSGLGFQRVAMISPAKTPHLWRGLSTLVCLKLFTAISLVFLSALMLLSSTGIRISQHWCGKRLVNTTIWGEATPCSHFDAGDKPACPMHSKQMKSKNCCDQREVIVEGGDDDYIGSFFSLQSPVGVVFQFFRECEPTTGIAAFTSCKFHNHSPPLKGPPLYLMIRSFLI